MGEQKDNISRIYEELSALKSIMDDFAKVVASVFNEIKSSVSDIQANTQAIQKSIQNLQSTLPQQLRDALQTDLNSLKEAVQSAPVSVPVPTSAFAAPAAGDAASSGMVYSRAGLRAPADAFTPLIDALERRSSAAEIADKLEEARDTLQSRYPSNPAFYEITKVVKQLKSKGSAKLDRSATNELMRMAEEWSGRIVK
jgi:DNA repair exonuclease SbcCD ATPase subunit